MAAISFQEGLRKLSFTIRRWLNDNAIINKGTLINNFDLNDFTNTGSSGYYFLSETNSYINAPNNFSKEGILINFVNSDNFYQLILDLDNCFYIRTKNNNIWFSWKNYNVSTFEEQILNINEFIGNVEEPKETSIIKKIEKIEENSKGLEKKIENLEYASKGVLYTDITEQRYQQRVIELIRQKYSQDDEFSILRQRDTKPEEFQEYNAYVEACKEQAKEEIKIK